MSAVPQRKRRERKEPWLDLPRREGRIMEDLANTLPCYAQTRDGWYTPSCYEAKARPACVNCRILNRLHRLLVAAGGAV